MLWRWEDLALSLKRNTRGNLFLCNYRFDSHKITTYQIQILIYWSSYWTIVYFSGFGIEQPLLCPEQPYHVSSCNWTWLLFDPYRLQEHPNHLSQIVPLIAMYFFLMVLLCHLLHFYPFSDASGWILFYLESWIQTFVWTWMFLFKARKSFKRSLISTHSSGGTGTQSLQWAGVLSSILML